MIRSALFNSDIRDRIAIAGDNASITYGDLAARAMSVRAALDLSAGSHAAVLLPNGADFLAALYGALASGLTAFPLSAACTRHEAESILKQSDTSVVITNRSFEPLFAGMGSRFDVIYMEDIPARKGEPLDPVAVDPDSPMILLATSGTTGRAKIVMLSERNIEACVLDYLEKMPHERIGADVRYILGLPFATAYGLFILSAIIVKGFAIVFAPEPFTLDAFYRAIEKHKATNYEGGALAITLMARNVGRAIPYDISSMRFFAFGGSGVSRDMLVELSRAIPWAEFWMGYGLTEAAPLITEAREHMPLDKLGSVGVAASGMELMIESDGKRTREPFVKGEVVVKAPNVMLGYYKNEAETARVIRGGWLHTGDAGWLDHDGYLYLCGRLRNIILVRGFTVYPEEVEACIMSSGLAADCAVYGQPDGFGGERVCADVVPVEPAVTAEAIDGWCAARLAEFKRPRLIALAESILKTASGKTVRARETIESDG
ncbi:MAG: acyl--CoA ligase [Oscillospiraceae bacterium]|jgi:long-chain acyl-CoA synthetase|nr:acyl--CoA ligase [Oscillospiraceae bacterium]